MAISAMHSATLIQKALRPHQMKNIFSLMRVSANSLPSLSKRTMSSYQKETEQVCCTSGTPAKGDYTGKGKITKCGDFSVYQVGSGPKGVIVFYDIFGFDIGNTRRFCDELAEGGLHVFMADHFRGAPWLLSDFPPAEMQKLVDWVGSAGTWEIVRADIDKLMPYAKTQGVENFGTLGFCWGGKQVVRCCATDEFQCGVGVHAAWLSEEDADAVKVPIAFLQAGDDPDLGPVKSVLEKKPFGKDCIFKVYKDEIHGFAAARGDLANEGTKKAFDEVVGISRTLLTKFI